MVLWIRLCRLPTAALHTVSTVLPESVASLQCIDEDVVADRRRKCVSLPLPPSIVSATRGAADRRYLQLSPLIVDRVAGRSSRR